MWLLGRVAITIAVRYDKRYAWEKQILFETRDDYDDIIQGCPEVVKPATTLYNLEGATCFEKINLQCHSPLLGDANHIADVYFIKNTEYSSNKRMTHSIPGNV